MIYGIDLISEWRREKKKRKTSMKKQKKWKKYNQTFKTEHLTSVLMFAPSSVVRNVSRKRKWEEEYRQTNAPSECVCTLIHVEVEKLTEKTLFIN